MSSHPRRRPGGGRKLAGDSIEVESTMKSLRGEGVTQAPAKAATGPVTAPLRVPCLVPVKRSENGPGTWSPIPKRRDRPSCRAGKPQHDALISPENRFQHKEFSGAALRRGVSGPRSSRRSCSHRNSCSGMAVLPVCLGRFDLQAVTTESRSGITTSAANSLIQDRGNQ